MIILCKHLVLFLTYTVTALFMIHYDKMSTIGPYIVFAAFYFGIMLIPKIHQIYVYNLVERMIPKWSYLLRATFHYCLYRENITHAFPAVLTILIIVMWKDIIFIINHGESRLAKIEKLLYDDGYDKRIVHLHKHVYNGDMITRFHDHCFDTNRLYLDVISPTAAETMLAIDNYRKIIKDGNKPREFKDNDEVYYKAAFNQNIFISQRWSFIALPIVVIGWTLAMTDTTGETKMYINHGIVLIDLLTTSLSVKMNDIVIDSLYLLSSLRVLVLGA